jgi:putative phosphoesterase
VEFAILSDTHWRERPPDLDRLIHRLSGAQLIFHAGDAVSASIIEAQEQVAPVYAVVGNCCQAGMRQRYPLQRVEEVAGLKVGMLHGHLLDLVDADAVLQAFPDDVKLVIHGHTHFPRCELRGDRWLFNPGSLSEPRGGCPPTYGWGIWDGGNLHLEHKRF